MEHVSYTELRQNLARTMDQVVDDHAPILVTRQGGRGSVVIISAEDFSGLEETVYLLSNPSNARHVLASIAEAEAGHTAQHDLAAEASLPSPAK
jgi:antitoxin YefM